MGRNAALHHEQSKQLTVNNRTLSIFSRIATAVFDPKPDSRHPRDMSVDADRWLKCRKGYKPSVCPKPTGSGVLAVQKKRDPKVPLSTCSPFRLGVLDQSPRRRLLVVRRHPVANGNRSSRISIGGTPHTTFRTGFARAGSSTERLTHLDFSSYTARLPCRND